MTNRELRKPTHTELAKAKEANLAPLFLSAGRLCDLVLNPKTINHAYVRVSYGAGSDGYAHTMYVSINRCLLTQIPRPSIVHAQDQFSAHIQYQPVVEFIQDNGICIDVDTGICYVWPISNIDFLSPLEIIEITEKEGKRVDVRTVSRSDPLYALSIEFPHTSDESLTIATTPYCEDDSN